MKVRAYLQESYNELMNKVTWPTWPELQSSAIIVMVTSLLIAIVIFFMDLIFGIHTTSAWKGILGFIYQLF